MGGEKQSQSAPASAVIGSPPRGRGKAFSVLRRQFRFRITPAWARKRMLRCAARLWRRDHPRVGGEKQKFLAVLGDNQGSPPHGRGKAPKAKRPGRAWGDHPRMGGEKTHEQQLRAAYEGSPPRWRGKAFRVGLAGRILGITPAWAGKSPASQPWSPPLWMMVIRPRP